MRKYLVCARRRRRPADLARATASTGRIVRQHDTEQNRALNRRVQFVRTEGVKEGCPKTGG